MSTHLVKTVRQGMGQTRPYSDLLGMWYAYIREPIVHANVNRYDHPDEYAHWESYVVYPQTKPVDVDKVAYRSIG